MTTLPPFSALEASGRWSTVDFISDLHLKPEEPLTFDAWAHYMAAPRADAVFILGDLFEAWVGDDGATPGSFEARCGDVLRDCHADVAFMQGNRDFLLGDDFLAPRGVRALPDPTVLSIAGQRLVLTHGDLLCTDDRPYQQFRAQVRAPAWQRAFLARPLAERRDVARRMRAESQARHDAHSAPDEYAHANHALARAWLLGAGATTLIHGHTHQPADHPLGNDGEGRALTQMVLSDWHIEPAERRAQVLRLDTESGRLARIDPQLARAS